MPAKVRFATRNASTGAPSSATRFENWLDSRPAGSPLLRRLGYI